ncbi:MAG: glycosyltransferase family 92 protein, partial [Candidatus Omnitrophica bacterium]|nr:glycosyltransferase family 92 protein [Candidatus Omnitrophota bacterium]
MFEQGDGKVSDHPCYLSVCAIIKDEAQYIKEWIEFHRIVGVEKFFIYDNGSSDDLKDVLAPYIREKIVSYQYWPEHPGQISAYVDCIKNFKDQSRWVAFIDADEFLFCSQSGDLRVMLREYEKCPGVCVNWVCFGSSGHRHKPEGLVVENFIRRAQLGWKTNRHVKSIVQLSEVLSPALNPHSFVYRNGRLAVTETGREIVPDFENLNGGMSQEVSIGKFRINHYMCKSFEEAQRKVNR